MKYIVIEARKPQDGSKAQQATILFPDWMSPTLVCAGITGRVIEMTDGSIVEQGKMPISDEEVLEGLRIDNALNKESQVEPPLSDTVELGYAKHLELGSNDIPDAPPLQTAADQAQQRDDAYREGMQAMRKVLADKLLTLGLPDPKMHPIKWIEEQVLALQNANDNLDAWRDAAGACPQIQQHVDEATGRIVSLSVGAQTMRIQEDVERIEQLTAELQAANRVIEALDPIDEEAQTVYRLCAAFGARVGEDRPEWLRKQLEELGRYRSGVAKGLLNARPIEGELISTGNAPVFNLTGRVTINLNNATS